MNLRKFESFEAVEAREVVIGKDDIELVRAEGPLERFPGFGPLDPASGEIRHQGSKNELCIGGIIFKVKKTNIVSHPTSQIGWASNIGEKAPILLGKIGYLPC